MGEWVIRSLGAKAIRHGVDGLAVSFLFCSGEIFHRRHLHDSMRFVDVCGTGAWFMSSPLQDAFQAAAAGASAMLNGTLRDEGMQRSQTALE